MNEPRHFSLPFLQKEQVAKGTYTFHFDTRGLSAFSFQPGQFIRMTLDLPIKDPRSNRRYFTISSSPTDQTTLSLTTKIIPSPSVFKQTLFSLEQGEEVSFWGPSGSFTLPDDRSIPIVMLSGGIGITPFHSMVTYLAKINSTRTVTLLASFSTEEEMVFYETLSSLQKQQSHLSLIYTLTHPQSSWTGERGRITKELLMKYVPHLSESMVYVSGPIPFVKALVDTVMVEGVTEERIKRDNFPGY